MNNISEFEAHKRDEDFDRIADGPRELESLFQWLSQAESRTCRVKPIFQHHAPPRATFTDIERNGSLKP